MKERILALHQEGKSYRQIQQELNCSKGTIAYHLGEGQKEKVLGRTKDRRTLIRRYIDTYKQSKGCADCKEQYPHWMLEFDHLRDKSFTIADYRTYTTSLEVIKEEIAKCDVVCSNCHAIRTYSRRVNIAP